MLLELDLEKRIVETEWSKGLQRGILQDMCITPDGAIWIISNDHKSNEGLVICEVPPTADVMSSPLPQSNTELQEINVLSQKHKNPLTMCVSDTAIFIGGAKAWHGFDQEGNILEYDRKTGAFKQRLQDIKHSVDALEVLGDYLYIVHDLGTSPVLMRYCLETKTYSAIAENVYTISKRGDKIYGLQTRCRNNIVSYNVLDISDGTVIRETRLNHKSISGFLPLFDVDSHGHILLFGYSKDPAEDKALRIFRPSGTVVGKAPLDETQLELFKVDDNDRLISASTQYHINKDIFTLNVSTHKYCLQLERLV